MSYFSNEIILQAESFIIVLMYLICAYHYEKNFF